MNLNHSHLAKNTATIFKTPCLLYDKECALCRRFKESLERTELNQQLYFYPIQEPKLLEAFPFLQADEIQSEVHLVLDHKVPNIIKGSEVVTYLSTLNPKIKKFAWLIESEVGKKATNIFYRSVNRYRDSLRKQCPKCKVKHSN